jgi:hypothetical protein
MKTFASNFKKREAAQETHVTSQNSSRFWRDAELCSDYLTTLTNCQSVRHDAAQLEIVRPPQSAMKSENSLFLEPFGTGSPKRAVALCAGLEIFARHTVVRQRK